MENMQEEQAPRNGGGIGPVVIISVALIAIIIVLKMFVG